MFTIITHVLEFASLDPGCAVTRVKPLKGTIKKSDLRNPIFYYSHIPITIFPGIVILKVDNVSDTGIVITTYWTSIDQIDDQNYDITHEYIKFVHYYFNISVNI